ncbi:hypothetical protein V1J52_13470 [Streptomyces sp. TRM 70351]|uniref:hypothetical protein n=1 Tax=Streptomyces sp. TRM 70351 TaxID=3116552 RepID=UPI002E7B7E88|nr:hypothetical protein [Streptomyces sp. TRM 70351]MEE1929174.1 hypothetical protein [Streptomyces sp. TRM 70351]
MQPPAGPDLPHTRTRTAHWLLTAVAVAAVLGATALLPSAGATASAAAPGPDPAAARYPVDCGPWELGVVDHAAADFDGDGRAETVAVVRCSTGTGTPPSGMFVLAHPAAEGGTPRVAATLVTPGDEVTVDAFSVRGAAVRAALLGYSSPHVPRCCPDLEQDAHWQWDAAAGAFRAGASPAVPTR